MFEHLNLQKRLLVSVLILGVALVATTIGGLLLARQLDENMKRIYNSSAPLNHLKKVSDAWVVGIAGAVQKTRNGESWENSRQILEDSIKVIHDDWQAYLDEQEDMTKDEKYIVQIVNATLKDNNLFLMQLREAFEQKNTKGLEILAQSNLYAVIDPIEDSMSKLIDLKWKNSQKLIDQAERSYDLAFGGMVVFAALSLGLGIGISVVVALGVSRRFQSIAKSLDSSADQVSTVSSKVSQASAQLATGASESAVNLTQTSAALNEIAIVTQRNAESATQASQLMDQGQATMIKSTRSMENTLTTMRSINESAEKVSKIVKAIEEIALQTNILSLNASVEAARAGEHGKGFAVVAEEVRNLAQRSAQAAKETTQLIQENADQAERGLAATEGTSAALEEMIRETKRVADLLSRIESASHNQSEGIHEISSTVSQMQVRTQNNNVNAKETADASEDMALHAASLRVVVKQLVGIVEGEEKKTRVRRKGQQAEKAAPSAVPSPYGDGVPVDLPKELPLPGGSGPHGLEVIGVHSSN